MYTDYTVCSLLRSACLGEEREQNTPPPEGEGRSDGGERTPLSSKVPRVYNVEREYHEISSGFTRLT